MKTILISVLSIVVKSFLSRLGRNLWDALWLKIFEAVVEAEKHWVESGKGEEKKDWVIRYVLEWLDGHIRVTWIHRRVLRLFINQLVDTFVEILNSNEETGKNWIKSVEKIEKWLRNLIPFF